MGKLFSGDNQPKKKFISWGVPDVETDEEKNESESEKLKELEDGE